MKSRLAQRQPELKFEGTQSSGLDNWSITFDDKMVGEVFVGHDTGHPPQSYINSISIVKDYRHQGVGRQVISMLAEKYGSLTSDPGGVTSAEAHSMWRNVPGARRVPSYWGHRKLNIWKVDGSDQLQAATR